MSMFKPIAPAEMRDEVRRRVLMQASLISIDGTQTVQIRDLTSSGARVSCVIRLEEDQDVIFRRGKLFVAARVAWSKRTEAGLQFYREVN